MLLYCTNKLLYNTVNKVSLWKSKLRKTSAITQAVSLSRKLELFSKPVFQDLSLIPPWFDLSGSFILDLAKFKKGLTNLIVYKKLYLEITNHFKEKGWGILFTDASKNDAVTSFGITDADGTTLRVGVLHPSCSVFSAEAFALYQAVEFAAHTKKKFLICTDSWSTIKSLLNPFQNSFIKCKTRLLLLKNNINIKIMWVPGHCGITGNEYADAAAKLATKQPLLLSFVLVKKDLTNWYNKQIHLEELSVWNTSEHHYTKVNSYMQPLVLPHDIPAIMQKIFVRFRIGHTAITHAYLLTNSGIPKCLYCDGPTFNVRHILDHCTALNINRSSVFVGVMPTDLLKITSVENINTVKLIFI